MTVKKFAWILIAAAVLAVIIVPAAAFANNGPHGGYVADTDMCAACHRAHTAPSSLTWTDNQGAQKNALLITDAAQNYLFCLACHDAGAQGADTNVVDGVYEGTQYGTFGGDMISGAFGRENPNLAPGALYDPHGNAVTSSHVINGQSWGAYGGGKFGSKASADATGADPATYGTGAKIVMDCTTCHDPHGSSNYRLLKDSVYGVQVGGYDGTAVGTDPFSRAYSASNPKPTPWVISNEVGFPLGGFQLHTTYSNYDPDYTVAKYAKPVNDDTSKGMTNWCAGCHTAYMVGSETSKYDAADGAGFVTRHRHPMNVRMDQYTGFTPLVLNSGLPLAQGVPAGNYGDGTVVNDPTDWIDCMTCHNAHGTTAVMKGYADPKDPKSTIDLGDTQIGLVAPDSALLKMDSRGVCEACHNK